MNTSCAQTEQEYLSREAEFLQSWDSERAKIDQGRPDLIPSWLNAPTWANWVQFCRKRGWVFSESEPHVYPDGSISSSCRFVKAAEVPGIRFFSNRHKATGSAAPFWVTDRRAGRTATGGEG